MLPRHIFKKVLKSVEHYRKQDDSDNAVPMDWSGAIDQAIRKHMREGHERCTDETVRATIQYLIEKGHVLQHPWGGVMFPRSDAAPPMPTMEEHKKDVMKAAEELGLLPRE